MPTIQAQTGVITQINVFTVPEGGQQALIDLLTEAAKASSQVEGWVSASLHRSLDGTRVVNYVKPHPAEPLRRSRARARRGGRLERRAELS